MVLIGKILCLMIVLTFSPALLVGAVRGNGFSAVQATVVAAGLTGFITLQWLI